MGSTRWSDDQYRDRVRHRARTGRDAFEHDAAVRQGEVERGVHEKMDPLRVRLRESRDSDVHPESRSVAVLFDVTGSMQSVPRILQANLPRLMNLLIDGRYLDHPQVLIGAIGDATCDAAPLQIGQFESGVEIDEDLGRLFLEGGGGGHITESYELAMYFMARHTAIDCWEKRGRRGYLFLIGDEIPYPRVKRKEVERRIGDRLQARPPGGGAGDGIAAALRRLLRPAADDGPLEQRGGAWPLGGAAGPERAASGGSVRRLRADRSDDRRGRGPGGRGGPGRRPPGGRHVSGRGPGGAAGAGAF